MAIPRIKIPYAQILEAVGSKLGTRHYCYIDVSSNTQLAYYGFRNCVRKTLESIIPNYTVRSADGHEPYRILTSHITYDLLKGKFPEIKWHEKLPAYVEEDLAHNPFTTSEERYSLSALLERETVMAIDQTKAVQTVTYVYGLDRASVSDDTIFSHIRTLEQNIKSLNDIENKPEKLKKRIEQYKADIDALVKLVDGE